MILRCQLVLLLIVTVSVTGQTPSPGGDPAYLVRIPSTDGHALRDTLASLDYDVECLGHSATEVEVVVSVAELQALSAAGFSPTIVQAAMPLATRLGANMDIPVGYRDLAAITSILNATQTSNPSIARVVNIAATYGPGATFEGRPILAIKISDNVLVDEDEPNVAFVSAHHCREIVTPEIGLTIIDRLIAGYGVNPTITNWINNNEIWVVPVVNPDGLNYTWTVNELWRKNRRPNADGTFGVDLNRNYDLGWSSTCAGSSVPSSETYKGTAPASEAETQTMIGFARARRFAKVIDYHSFGREVLLSYLCTPMPTAIETFIDTEALALAGTVGYATRQPSGDGQHPNFQCKEITEYAFLTETELTFQPPYANAQAESNLLWAEVTHVLNRPIPIVGHVTHAITGAPIVANISVVGITWSNGESRKSSASHGRYHLFLSAGNFQIQASAPGFVSQTLPVTVIANASTTLNFNLQPAFSIELSSTGGGVGDLHLALTNIPPTCNEGFTLFSLATSLPPGTGALFGLNPDLLTFQTLTSPPGVGNIFHFVAPQTPGVYPALPFNLPPGALPFVAGTSVDGVGVALGPGPTLLGLTQVGRGTF